MQPTQLMLNVENRQSNQEVNLKRDSNSLLQALLALEVGFLFKFP